MIRSRNNLHCLPIWKETAVSVEIKSLKRILISRSKYALFHRQAAEAIVKVLQRRWRCGGKPFYLEHVPLPVQVISTCWAFYIPTLMVQNHSQDGTNKIYILLQIFEYVKGEWIDVYNSWWIAFVDLHCTSTMQLYFSGVENVEREMKYCIW